MDVNINHKASNSASPELTKLDQYRSALEEQRSSTTKEAEIKMIDDAIKKIDVARKEVDPTQTKLGQYSQVKAAIKTQTPEEVQETISENEAKAIMAMKAIKIKNPLQPGQKFASMTGKEPSNISFVKDSIGALYDLVDSKSPSIS